MNVANVSKEDEFNIPKLIFWNILLFLMLVLRLRHDIISKGPNSRTDFSVQYNKGGDSLILNRSFENMQR